ncbi:sugar kinase [Vibrio crassostreae]|uniref:sugar kinase n=1 Tax=Vibrio crassostreae TaxID=246167 RepID=UPI000F4932CE|nr:sugar kinase [Vibrio crassostreae]ROR20667.1 2-dehydro-3-deoxygluconokinase [Vibrio crassostreae]TCV31974.1 2-dehydro-3-deoxygluconokinase [Vibrio crassostreae]
MKSLNIAVIGECMVELQKKQDGLKQSFGGDTLNTALYLSRLTKEQDIQTSYVTALGTDPFSIDMLKKWQAEGIDTSLVAQLDHKQPGLYYIETDETGERSFHYWRSDAAAKFMFDQPDTSALLDKLFSFDAVYLSGITLAILTENGRAQLFSFLDRFKAQGGQVFFDNNYRPKLWESQQEAISWYLKMLKYTDTALLTFDDEQELYGDESIEQCIARTSECGVKEIIIKRGAKDCLVVESQSARYVAPHPVNNIVDTTAAGDSFSAGFLAKRLSGGNASDAALSGHIVAGTVIQHPGAIIPLEATPDLSL